MPPSGDPYPSPGVDQRDGEGADPTCNSFDEGDDETLPGWLRSDSTNAADHVGESVRAQQRVALGRGLKSRAYDVYGEERKSIPALSASLARAACAAMPVVNGAYLEKEGGVSRPVRTASTSAPK